MSPGPGNADTTLSLALDLHRKGDLEAAAALYRALLQSHPKDAQLWGLLGSLRRASGDAEEAVRCLERAVSCAPSRIDLKAELGVALSAAARHADAFDLLDAMLPALAAQGQDAALVYAALADACLGLDRLEDATDHYRTALAKAPDNPAARVNLGTALQRLGRHAEAIAAYERVLENSPDDLLALTNLGLALQEAGRLDDSLAPLERAIEIDPADTVARSGLGVTLHKLGRPDEAEAAFSTALDHDPAYALAWSNLGNLLQDRLMLAEARMAHECALALDRADAELQWNYAMALLLDGDLVRGFTAYEWRRKRASFDRPALAGPDWDGADPAGRTILLYTEQGLGDAIQFSRYASLLAQSGAAVILACPAATAPLFATLDGEIEIVSNWDAAPPYDCHAPLMSLPYLMNTTRDDIPSEVPYLSVPPGRPTPLDRGDGRMRVGLVWAGNPGHPNDKNRSIDLKRLRPLFEIEGIEWIALQLGDPAQDIAASGLPLLDLSPRLNDFADTAAAMADLDLVICVDTAPAHLAGALGRPVWTLLPFAPDWRWLTGQSSSPWYPTMRLFRQPAPGDWGSVVRAVAEALSERLAR